KLGTDPNRNNDFSYSDDMAGLKSSFCAHILRGEPRGAFKDDFVAVHLHPIIWGGTNYRPPLPLSIIEDCGVKQRGGFLLVGAYIKRQFEFVQSQWITDGNFIRQGTEQDPIIGNNEGDGIFTIPKRPIRRRLQELPRFVVVRGGEYLFMPGLRALKWLA